jgi:hypothetical protein
MKTLVLAAIACLVSLGVTAQTNALEREFLTRLRAMQALQAGAMPGNVPGAANGAPTAPLITEEALAKKVDALRHPTEIADIIARKDGFVVNGRPYVDPEGRISRYAIDAMTGEASYIAEITSGQGKLKWVSLASPDEPVEFGTAIQGMNGWSVTTVSGKTIAGDLLVLIPSGVMVGRQTALFRYDPGLGVKSVAVPAGYVLAPLQHGAAGSTDTVLLEREPADGGANPLFDLGRSLSRLAGAKAEDYAFFNLSSGVLIPINVDSNGKTTQSYSQCRKKNAAVNVCDRMTSFEALYNGNGLKNMTHYYWRANWFKTRTGSYAVVQENGLKEVNVIDLSNGRRAPVFERGLGITEFNAKLTREGKLRVVASWVFQDHVVEDAEALLQSSLAKSVEAESVAK